MSLLIGPYRHSENSSRQWRHRWVELPVSPSRGNLNAHGSSNDPPHHTIRTLDMWWVLPHEILIRKSIHLLPREGHLWKCSFARNENVPFKAICWMSLNGCWSEALQGGFTWRRCHVYWGSSCDGDEFFAFLYNEVLTLLIHRTSAYITIKHDTMLSCKGALSGCCVTPRLT